LTFLLDQVEGRHVDGTLAVGKLESEGLQLTELTDRALSEGEILEINPLEADVYGGRYRGSFEVALGSEPLHVRFLQRVDDMALGDPLEALFGWAVLESQVDTQWQGAFSGLYWDQVRDSLEASGELRLRDGRINRFSLERLIEDAVPAGLGGAQTEPFAEDASTAFSVISGSLQLSEGELANSDARARSEHFAVRGSGDLDLETARLDYRLQLNILRTFDTESERLLELLRGVSFPLRLHGPLTDLELELDPQQLIDGVQEDEETEDEG
ncbi:MAG: hypothetical protein LAT50_01680, partial [Ectothiorhodospiraceae bacterium]|nr:hypothetical protein [Ectothiorhodospiraceae bacterium]